MDALQTAQLLRWRQVPDRAIELYELGLAGDTSWLKQADKIPRMLGQATGFFPSVVSDFIPGVPSPLAATLAGGMLGAGAGYGAGWLMEQALPTDWRRHRLRRTLATLGGLAGATPGALWGYASTRREGLPGLFSGVPLDTPPTNSHATDVDSMSKVSLALTDLSEIPLDPLYKQAMDSRTGLFPEHNDMVIDVDAFNDTLWQDPYVSKQLPPHIRAAASGLVTGASHLSNHGQETHLVTPFDIARMAIGMGSGYASGALVGKTLGVLMGMPEPTQNRLKQTGMWAGLIANVVPMAFGG